MTVSAREVAAVLRERLPGLPVKKLHKLLYYCQGHHLATFAEPLFGESLSAWDMGPVVGELWKEEKEGIAGGAVTPSPLTEGQLNTIGYVLSRYGGLSGRDLETLTHGESPWQLANLTRRPKGTVRIEREWIKDYFDAGVLADDDDDEVRLDPVAIRRWLYGADARRGEPVHADSPALIRERLAQGA